MKADEAELQADGVIDMSAADRLKKYVRDEINLGDRGFKLTAKPREPRGSA